MLTTIAEKAIDGIFARIANAFEKAEKTRDRELTGKAMLRAYYIEVRGNLDLLGSLSKTALKDHAVNSPAFSAIVNRLETRIAEAILTDDETARENGLFRILQTTNAVSSESSGEVSAGVTYRNVLEAVSFTLVKITVMRKLSSLTDEEKTILHGIRLARRVENLKTRLESVLKTLRSLGGVTGIPPDEKED